MLGFISGTLKDRQANECMIFTGTHPGAGVGYLVRTPDHPRYDRLVVGDLAELYLYTHVREDALELYGFLNANEKNLFMTLLSVSGVGPKMALSLLSQTDEATLIDYILSEDKASLTRIPGVGKKTAERMVLELKDTIQKKLDQGLFGKVSPREPTSDTAKSGRVSATDPLFIEAYLAIQGLGFKEAQAKQMVEKALQKSIEKTGTRAPLEEVIRLALQG